MEKFGLTYYYGLTSVTDAIGTKEDWRFSVNLGVYNLLSRKNLTDNKALYQTFDTNNNLTCRQDEEGRVTTWTYNTSNQRASETTGRTGACSFPVTTSATRTTTYQYLSPTLDLPTLIESPSVYGTNKKRVTISYSGNLPTVITRSGYTPIGGVVSRTVSLGYNATGQVTSINGPRTDVNDVTTLTYYDCTAGGACGQLQRITNALGQTTTFDNYDAAGRLTEMTDPNGLKTTYSYDARGRVTSVTQTPVGGVSRTTNYTYDAAGNVLTASLPTGLALTYTYSAALKLTRVADNLGHRVDYGYDLKGNRITEKTYDPSGTLVRSIDSAYDTRNRVNQLNDGDSITKQVFDAVGNLTKVTDPNTVAANGTTATTNTFDALNRLTKTVDLLAGNANYTYDVNDRLKSAQAANGATTQYQYDDLGNLTKEISPDRGTTTYTYDAAGNVLTQTDARGVTASYSYDVLNRLATASYNDTSENITYTYDSGSGCTYGVGRLCRVQDAAGASDYSYDGFGNVLTHTRTEMSVAYTTRYTYDSGNRVSAITYPNGRQVSYTRDPKGNLLTASMALGGTVTPLVTESVHRPDGQLTSRRYGNGLNETRAYSLQGKLREQYLGAADTRLYSYDPNGNLTSEQSLPQVGAYTYDALNRLTRDQITSTPASDTGYTYDANGNRKTAGTGTYAYLASTNRLTNALGQGISLDAAGNTTSDGARSYSYHQAGTLGAVTGIATYRYNAQRQRTRKVMGSEATVYHYDLAGNLIAETRVDGSLIRDYVWVDATPVAQMESSGQLTYLHTDHLNTPRLGTDSAQQVVWRWEGKAFGDTAASGSVTVNLRLPGQYYDAESGLHYNWNRYYDPRIGRYITSDPIGLAGGLNTYAYVGNNPLFWVDPDGLRVLNPRNKPISPSVMNALKQFNQCIGCDKDIEITGGDRPGDPGQHGKGLAADIIVPGQNHLLTANQAIACGIFGGIGWYQEGYYDPNDPKVGPHVHVDLGPSGRVWGHDVNRYPYRGRIPAISVRKNLSCGSC
jgi:RHS repeat-associated protein